MKIRANDISECADCVGWRCIMLSNERPVSERKQARMRVDGAGSFTRIMAVVDEWSKSKTLYGTVINPKNAGFESLPTANF